MEFTKQELDLVLTDTKPETSIRFAFAGEELEVDSIDPYEGSGDVWVTLFPKGEIEQETGPWYVGRHRQK